MHENKQTPKMLMSVITGRGGGQKVTTVLLVWKNVENFRLPLNWFRTNTNINMGQSLWYTKSCGIQTVTQQTNNLDSTDSI